MFAINNDNLCLYANAGKLADLNALPERAGHRQRFGTSAERQPAPVGNQRQQLGFPFASGAELLYYNKTMFDAAGLDYPTPEWTFQDVLDAAAKLTTDTNGDGQPDQWGYFPNYLNEETYYAVIHRFGGRYYQRRWQDGRSTIAGSDAGLQFHPRPQLQIHSRAEAARP